MEHRWSRGGVTFSHQSASVRLLLLMCAHSKEKLPRPELLRHPAGVHPSPSEEAADVAVDGLKAQASRCDYVCWSNEIRTVEQACISR